MLALRTGLPFDCTEHDIRRQRELVDGDTDGVVERVGYCGEDRGQPALAALLGAEGPLGIDALDQ
ncbi:MAG: hypothetical protein VX498_15880 [Myxococcota bacterium]|nr:hypothetical protein [Myxococcota bacterium]